MTVTGVKSCWLGIIRDTVHGNVRDFGNTLAHPDANEIVTNTIFQSLACDGNSPVAQDGDSGGQPNVVHGAKIGECASL